MTTTSNKSTEELRERFFEIHNNRLDLQPNEKVSDAEILMCFNGSGNRMQTASTIANYLDVHTSTIRKRLKELEENHMLYRERVGGRDIWTLRHFFATPFSSNILDHLEGRIDE